MEKDNSKVRIILITVLLTLAIVGIAFALFMKMSNLVFVNEKSYNNAVEQIKGNEKFFDIQRLIDETFLWEYDQSAEKEAIYRSMLDSLGDQYTRYLNEGELQDLIDSMNSSFTGVGVVFMQTEEGFIITEVINEGPAYYAGLKAGDYILKVDGEEFENSDDMAHAIRGEAGTQVKLLIKRDKEEIEFDIVRGKIEDASVEGITIEDGKLGYIRIKSFGDDTAKNFDKALSQLESQGVQGLVIDLRNNSGGLFDEGVKIADRLLAEGIVSYAEDKNGNRENYNSDAKHTELTMVVLTNGATASTSEMLAAALKDYGVTLVGEKTFGKGIMQETHIYSDNTAVNVTVREFFSPNGNKIHGAGVEPTEVVPYSYELEDTQLNRAIELLLKKKTSKAFIFYG